MQYEIITFGNGEILQGVFNAIAICLNSASGTLYMPLIKISMIIGSLWAALYALYGDYMRAVNHWIIPMTAIMQLLLVPQATVWINDPVSRYQQKVDHVPYGLAMIAGNISKIGYLITQQVEKVLVLPDDLKYQKTGSLFAANLLQQAKTFRITNQNLANNMQQFVEQCIVYDALIGRKYTIEALKHSDNLWGLVSKEPSPIRSFVWRDVTVDADRPYIITCKDGVNKFNQLWEQEITNTATLFGKKIFGNNNYINAKVELFKFLPLAYSTLTNITKSAEDLLKQQLMIYAVVDGIEQKSTSLGNHPNFALQRAYLQQRASYQTLGALVADALPVIKGVLEAICYTAFLFIMPLAILPFGWVFIKNWVQTLLWLQMWAPLYAMLNYIMTLAAKAKSITALALSNEAGVTIASSLGLVNVNADLAAIAGYLAISIPFLALAITKGAGALVNVAAGLTGVSQSAAQQATSDAVSGNYSFGNITQGTQQIANTSMLNQSYAASLRSGSFLQADGNSEFITGNDRQIVNISSSNLPLTLNVAKTQSGQLMEQASHCYQQGVQHAESFASNMAATLRQGVELSEHLNNSEQHISGIHDSKTIEQIQALNKSAQIIKDFAKEHDLTTTQAAQVVAVASIGSNTGLATLGLINVGAKFAGNISGSASSHNIYKKAEKIANSEELQQGLRQAQQLAQNQTFSQHVEQGKRLLDTMLKSWDAADSYKKEANKSFSEAQNYSQQAGLITSTAAAINANYTQEFVDWLALQAADNTNGHIGKYGAAFIIANNPELSINYAQQFLASKNLLPTDVNLRSAADNLRASYQKASQQQFTAVKESDALANINSFKQQVTSSLVRVKEDPQQKFNEQQHRVEQQLAVRQQQATKDYNESAKRHSKQAENSLAGQALQQGGKQAVELMIEPMLMINNLPIGAKELIKEALTKEEDTK